MRGGGRGEAPTQSGQDQWCSLLLRRECFADAPLVQRDRRSCSCGLRVIVPWWRSLGSHSGLQRAAAIDVAQRWRRRRSSRRLLSLPLPGCGGVVFCCVRYLCGSGVRFGVLCTNVSSFYMMRQCSCLLFKKTGVCLVIFHYFSLANSN